VDDFLICYRSKSVHCTERVLQGCPKKIALWADNNGFKFSKSKTACMHLCNKRTPHPEPSLRLCNTEIPVLNETKFLGVIFDCKLTFKPHIANLRKEVPESHEHASHGRTHGLGSRQHDSAETFVSL
jgi:hypothetical protein